jgi:hypothetical protein
MNLQVTNGQTGPPKWIHNRISLPTVNYSLKPWMSTSRPMMFITTKLNIYTHTYILVREKKHSSLLAFPACRACANWSQEVVRPRLVAGCKELAGFEGYLMIRAVLTPRYNLWRRGQREGHPEEGGLMVSVRLGSRRHACLLPAGCGSNRRVDFEWRGCGPRGRHTPPVSLRPPSVRRPLHVTRVLSYYSSGF